MSCDGDWGRPQYSLRLIGPITWWFPHPVYKVWGMWFMVISVQLCKYDNNCWYWFASAGPASTSFKRGRPQSCKLNVKSGDAGDRENGGPTYTGPECGNRSDQELVLKYQNPLCLYCLDTIVRILLSSTKNPGLFLSTYNSHYKLHIL